MKRLYKSPINYYELMIDWQKRLKREWNFLEKHFKENKVKSIMDVACGIGKHAIFFTKNGYDVAGIDIDENAIKQAKKNAQQENVEIIFKTASFDKIADKINKKYDAITCLGNSIAFTDSTDSLRRSLDNFYRLLDTNGILIIQFRNYWRLRKTTGYEYFTPKNFTYNGIEYFVLRVADIVREDKLRMKFFIVKGEKEVDAQSVDLLLINPLDFKKILTEIGFKKGVVIAYRRV